MANEKKSIIEEALLEASNIDATFKSNAKEILAHTMGSEIEEMVKESLTGSKTKRNLKEEDETDLDLELDSDDEVEVEGDELDLNLDTEDGEEDENTEDEENEEVELNLELGDEDGDLDDTDDIDLDLGGLSDEDGDTDLSGLGLGDEDNTDLDLDLGGEGDETDVETMDLTGASDSDVISVFKKMGPEDEIEVVNDNGMVTLKDNKSGSEYRIELNTGGQEIGSVETSEIGPELELGESTEEDENLEEGVIYEIVVEDDETEEDDMSDYMEDENWGSKEHEFKRENGHKTGNVDGHYKDYEMEDGENEDNMSYMSRTLGAGEKFGRNGLPKPKTYKDMSGIYTSNNSVTESKILNLTKENTNLNTKNLTIENENKELKENHDKMVDALKQFRTKLQEVAVFNSNLTYAVRLFTENSTTKDEKQEILKRLDGAKSIKESQSIYKQLMKEYSSGKAPIKESIDEKINKTASSGASQISEQSVFVHPELKEMKKLWEYNYKK